MVQKTVMFLFLSICFLAANVLAEDYWSCNGSNPYNWIADANDVWDSTSHTPFSMPIVAADTAYVNANDRIYLEDIWDDGGTPTYIGTLTVGRWEPSVTHERINGKENLAKTATGEVDIRSGGRVDVENLIIAERVDGGDPNSNGNRPHGHVMVQSGGTLNANDASGTGNVMVVAKGDGMVGVLEVSGGTFATAGTGGMVLALDGNANTLGTVIVSGSGSMTLGGDLSVDQPGEIIVEDTATLSVGGDLTLGGNGAAIMEIDSGTTVSVTGALSLGANGTMGWDADASGNVETISVTGTATITDGATIEVLGGVPGLTKKLISATTLSVTIANVNVNGNHVLSVNGNDLEVTFGGGGIECAKVTIVDDTPALIDDGTTWFGNDSSGNRVTIMAFQLPDLGTDVIDSAELECVYEGTGDVKVAADLWGMDRNSASDSNGVPGDYYVGYFAGDTETPIQGGLTDAVNDPNGILADSDVVTNADGNLRLKCFVQARDDAGSASDYIFLRLNHRYTPTAPDFFYQRISSARINYMVDSSTTGCAPAAATDIPLCAGSTQGESDINDDCTVDLTDAIIMGKRWLQTHP